MGGELNNELHQPDLNGPVDVRGSTERATIDPGPQNDEARTVIETGNCKDGSRNDVENRPNTSPDRGKGLDETQVRRSPVKEVYDYGSLVAAAQDSRRAQTTAEEKDVVQTEAQE